MDLKYLLYSVIFTNSVGFLLNLGGYLTFSSIPFLMTNTGTALIIPTLSIVQGATLVIAIGASNTPIAKGVALAIYVVTLFAFFLTLSIPNTMPIMIRTFIYGVLFVPTFLGAGFTFLDLGKG